MVRTLMFATALAAIFVASVSARADESTRVAIIPGGPHPYFAPWEAAGAAAKRDFHLGAADYRVPQKWEVSEQNALVEGMLVKGYNGFLLFPSDPVGGINLVRELVDAGVPVISTAGCLQDPSPAAFCFGTDTARSAYIGATELIKALAGTQKRILHLTSNVVDPNTQGRIEAVERAAKENGATVVQVIADLENPQLADDKIKSFLAARSGDIDGIMSTGWISAATAATALRNNNEHRIKLVGTDHDQATLSAIKDGFAVGTMIQNAYGQAYVGSYAIDLLRSGCTVKADAPFISSPLTKKFIDSGTVFVDAKTVDTYPELMQQMTEALLKDFKDKYFTCK